MCVEERIFVYALFFLLFHATNINYKEGCDIEGWNFIQLQKIMFSHIVCFELCSLHNTTIVPFLRSVAM